MEFLRPFQSLELLTLCPLSHQPVLERGSYKVGENRYLSIVRVQPVSNGKNAKVFAVSSRAARDLPSQMLTAMTGLKGIKCERRDPCGHIVISTDYDIPKRYIDKVCRELNSTMLVKWRDQSIGKKPLFYVPTFKKEKSRLKETRRA